MPYCQRLVAACLLLGSTGVATAADGAKQAASDKQALASIQVLVGQWRGVGQPKRGSNQGAWSEETDWSWHFDSGRAELVANLSNDKYFSRLQVQPGDRPGQFVLLAEPSGEGQAKPASQRYTGARATPGCSRPTTHPPTAPRGSRCGWWPGAIA